jgi:hypothetical protein
VVEGEWCVDDLIYTCFSQSCVVDRNSNCWMNGLNEWKHNLMKILRFRRSRISRLQLVPGLERMQVPRIKKKELAAFCLLWFGLPNWGGVHERNRWTFYWKLPHYFIENILLYVLSFLLLLLFRFFFFELLVQIRTKEYLGKSIGLEAWCGLQVSLFTTLLSEVWVYKRLQGFYLFI